MKLDTLEKLYVHELKDLWSANKQVLALLPSLNGAVSDVDLDNRLNGLREQTEARVANIEKIFDGLDFGPQGHKCEGMEGLVKEARGLIGDCDDKKVCAAGVIASVQRMLHYFMAGYGTSRALAEKLGRYPDADVLQDDVSKIGAEDTALSRLADRKINFEALVAA